MTPESTHVFVEFVVVGTAMWLMVRTGFRYKVLKRRSVDRCASCGRLLSSDCGCRR
jgi:hypothetical protein